jgi:hypothetical protein
VQAEFHLPGASKAGIPAQLKFIGYRYLGLSPPGDEFGGDQACDYPNR